MKKLALLRERSIWLQWGWHGVSFQDWDPPFCEVVTGTFRLKWGKLGKIMILFLGQILDFLKICDTVDSL